MALKINSQCLFSVLTGKAQRAVAAMGTCVGFEYDALRKAFYFVPIVLIYPCNYD